MRRRLRRVMTGAGAVPGLDFVRRPGNLPGEENESRKFVLFDVNKSISYTYASWLAYAQARKFVPDVTISDFTTSAAISAERYHEIQNNQEKNKDFFLDATEAVFTKEARNWLENAINYENKILGSLGITGEDSRFSQENIDIANNAAKTLLKEGWPIWPVWTAAAIAEVSPYVMAVQYQGLLDSMRALTPTRQQAMRDIWKAFVFSAKVKDTAFISNFGYVTFVVDRLRDNAGNPMADFSASFGSEEAAYQYPWAVGVAAFAANALGVDRHKVQFNTLKRTFSEVLNVGSASNGYNDIYSILPDCPTTPDGGMTVQIVANVKAEVSKIALEEAQRVKDESLSLPAKFVIGSAAVGSAWFLWKMLA